MMQALLDRSIESGQTWLELPGVQIADLRPRGSSGGAPELLRHALRRGLAADPDPRRRDFYETSIDGYSYYFNVLPGRPARVFLLARWPSC